MKIQITVSPKPDTPISFSIFSWFRKFASHQIFNRSPEINKLSILGTGAHFEGFFTEIVKKCIEHDLIRRNRFIIDSTDVAANVNYPSEKELARSAFKKVIKEVAQFNETLADNISEAIECEIDIAYEKDERVSWRKHFEITQKYLDFLYLRTYDELQHNDTYREAFGLCYDLLYQYTNNTKDKIVSIVDPDARVAHKSPGKIKKGYKDHIIMANMACNIIRMVNLLCPPTKKVTT